MKISMLKQQTGIVRIITHSLPDIEYVKEQIDRRPKDIYLICNSDVAKDACELKTTYPNIRIATNNNANSKILLIEPDTIYLGSQDFGKSNYHETVVGIRSKEAHDWYIENSFIPLWDSSMEINN